MFIKRLVYVWIIALSLNSFGFASSEIDLRGSKTIEELASWDKVAIDLINSNGKPVGSSDRLFAYLYNAQNEYFLKNPNFQNVNAISYQILQLFYPSLKPNSTDNNNDEIANHIAEKYRKRFHNEEKQIHPFPIKESMDSWKGTEPYTGIKTASLTPWFLKSADQFRLPKPPAANDPFWLNQLSLVKQKMNEITEAQKQLTYYWAGMAFQNSGDFITIAEKYMSDKKIPLKKRLEVRSLLASALFDATIANYDSKYTYLVKRPNMVDTNLKTLIPTPNHPSFPAGHAVCSGAAATVLSFYFPEKSEEWFRQANECSDSRLWSGLHFPIDLEKGKELGQQVAKYAIDNRDKINLSTSLK